MALTRRLALTVLAAVAGLAVLAALASAPILATDQAGEGQGGASATGLKLLAAGLAVGLAGIGGGYAVGVAGAAGISAIAEKSEVSGMALLIVAMGEGIAIYGLLVAILLIFVV